MNKHVLKTTMLAAIASLGISSQVWAHHPSEEMNPNFEMVDEQVSDMHNEAIDAMIEDGDLMSSTARGMDATSMTTSMASGDSTDAGMAAARGTAETVTATGGGAVNATTRGSNGRR